MFAIARAAAVALLSGLLLFGCASQPAPKASQASSGGNHYAPQQSIIVPDQQTVLADKLRQALAERGWHLIGYSKDMTSGHADYQAMARQAKYRLTLLGTSIGRCRNGDPSFLYRIALIENTGGSVPVALSGADCLSPIIDEFATDLDEKQLAPIPRQPTQNASGAAQS